MCVYPIVLIYLYIYIYIFITERMLCYNIRCSLRDTFYERVSCFYGEKNHYKKNLYIKQKNTNIIGRKRKLKLSNNILIKKNFFFFFLKLVDHREWEVGISPTRDIVFKKSILFIIIIINNIYIYLYI